MLARHTGLGAGVVLVAITAGLFAPAPPARANDAGKIIAAIAAGALVYTLIDQAEERHCYRPPRCAPPPPAYYYRPRRCGPRHAYNRGYRHGFHDGYRVGVHVGYRYGYADGRFDQWVADTYSCTRVYVEPVVIGPCPPWY